MVLSLSNPLLTCTVAGGIFISIVNTAICSRWTRVGLLSELMLNLHLWQYFLFTSWASWMTGVGRYVGSIELPAGDPSSWSPYTWNCAQTALPKPKTQNKLCPVGIESKVWPKMDGSPKYTLPKCAKLQLEVVGCDSRGIFHPAGF